MLCCPRCGSTEIFLETGGFTGNIYRCKKCGYRGALVLEIEKDEKAGGDWGDMEPGED